MQWMTLFEKEMLENWRNKKWIWVPLVIMLLSVMDPLSSYYMPQIIDSVGGMPDGMVIQVPDYSPPDVIMMTLSQLNSLGVLVLVLTTMGTISSERKSGVSELILVKPVSYKNYITSKWLTSVLLVWLSLFLGLCISWYYINLLFGSIAFTDILKVIFFYGLWFVFIVSLSIFYNTWVRSFGIVAFLTILSIGLVSMLPSIFGEKLAWIPSNLTEYVHQMLTTGNISMDLYMTAIVTLVLCALLLVCSVSIFKTKELASS
ncbi:MAG TPA: ABC transporter permease subunit [Virgibacillus sp.]|nr:ABC transporter permease subunit [Virgibacillus sp.]